MNGGEYPYAELVVETGELAGTHFPLDRPLIAIGRAEDNDIVLPDEMVSKSHSRIIIQGNNFLIEDLGSSNGTIVNGETVNNRILAEGDKLYLGHTTLAFTMSAPPAAAAPEKTKGSRKGIWISVGILGSLVLAAGVLVLVIFLVKGCGDKVPPTITINEPKTGYRLELHLPVKNTKIGVGYVAKLTFGMTARDNEKLDKVEIKSDKDVLKTYKAVQNNRKQEFTYLWKVDTPDTYAFAAVAYDTSGNKRESQPVEVKVVEGVDILNLREFEKLMDDPYFAKYNRITPAMRAAYRKAKKGGLPWDELGLAFNSAREELEKLQSEMHEMNVPDKGKNTYLLMDETITYTIQEAQFGTYWAADMYDWDRMYGDDPANPLNPPRDPLGYEAKMLNARRIAQATARRCAEANNTVRVNELAAEPVPGPYSGN